MSEDIIKSQSNFFIAINKSHHIYHTSTPRTAWSNAHSSLTQYTIHAIRVTFKTMKQDQNRTSITQIIIFSWIASYCIHLCRPIRLALKMGVYESPISDSHTLIGFPRARQIVDFDTSTGSHISAKEIWWSAYRCFQWCASTRVEHPQEFGQAIVVALGGLGYRSMEVWRAGRVHKLVYVSSRWILQTSTHGSCLFCGVLDLVVVRDQSDGPFASKRPSIKFLTTQVHVGGHYQLPTPNSWWPYSTSRS